GLRATRVQMDGDVPAERRRGDVRDLIGEPVERAGVGRRRRHHQQHDEGPAHHGPWGALASPVSSSCWSTTNVLGSTSPTAAAASVGCVPSRNTSSIDDSSLAFGAARRPVFLSILAVTTPAGALKLLSGLSLSALAMKSIQMGSAAFAPSSPAPRLRMSS